MTHTPGPNLCGRCGEPQSETQDWFGEAVRMKAINADLLAALKAALPYLEHSLKFYRYQQAGHEFWPNREEAEGNITEARAAIEKAAGN